MDNLAALLDEAAALHGSRPALLRDGTSIDYATLQERATRCAGLLRAHGIGPGDRVAILLPNVPEFVAAYFGALRLGAVVVPLNALLKSLEIEERLADAEAKLLVAPPEREPELAECLGRHAVALLDPALAAEADPVGDIVDREPSEPAVLLYTSGTTGGPKGAELTHEGLRFAANCLAGPLLGLTPDDVLFGAAPLAHIFGQSGVMNAAIVAGACVLLVSRFEPAVSLELMRQTSTTVFLGVPTMVIGLLGAAESAPELPPFRVAHSGGAPLAVEVLGAFTARFGCPMLEGYGLTETSGAVVTHHLGQATKAGSVGTVVDGAELRIVDGDGRLAAGGEIGEVSVRGPGIMRGYWHSPDATAAALDAEGWFATGDMGYLDADGYLFLVDRKKDMIIRGGYNVYPREVEEIVYQHPSVLEAVVVGVPEPRLGEEVVALVVTRPGLACDPDEVREFVRERIAAYKYPRLVIVTDALPRGPSGKILKREIDRNALRNALLAARRDEAL
jgi:long-chain acyl-CoA synthetase